MHSRALPVVLLALGCLAGVQSARAEPDAPTSPSTLTYDFEDELVSGDLVSAFGEQLAVRRRGTRASLIELRTSYVDELVQSIEDL